MFYCKVPFSKLSRADALTSVKAASFGFSLQLSSSDLRVSHINLVFVLHRMLFIYLFYLLFI